MSTLSDILGVAKSGLLAQQIGLRVTSNNVSNANTVGYSRQLAIMSTTGESSGGGVTVASVQRAHDDLLEQQVNQQNSRGQFLAGRQLVTDQLDAVFTEIDGNGINTAMSDFFNSFSKLAADVTDTSCRQNVITEAQTMITRFQSAATSLDSLKGNLNSEIKTNVDRSNQLVGQIAEFNRKLASYNDSNGSQPANDLLDKRDAAVKELSGLLPISTYSDNAGNINISVEGQTLVDGARAGSVQIVGTQQYGVSVTSVAGNTTDVTSDLAGGDKGQGKISGLLYERDGFIKDLSGQLDQLAYSVATKVNSLHTTGYGTDGTTGRNFFTPLASASGAAKSLSLSDDVKDKPYAIAAASSAATAKGDNKTALALSALSTDSTTMGGSSFADYFDTMITDSSARINNLASDVSAQDTITAQAETYRSSVSGVSTNEELVALIQYQRAFQASAKMVSAVDQMLNTVINMKQ